VTGPDQGFLVSRLVLIWKPWERGWWIVYACMLPWSSCYILPIKLYRVSQKELFKPCTLQRYFNFLNALQSDLRMCTKEPTFYDTNSLIKGHWQPKFIIASSERAWKNKPVGRLMLYSISSSSEVIRKNVQNINCRFSTTCDVISWVSMFIE
jgi:hypothetical protein